MIVDASSDTTTETSFLIFDNLPGHLVIETDYYLESLTVNEK